MRSSADERIHGLTVFIPLTTVKSRVRLPGDIISRLRLRHSLRLFRRVAQSGKQKRALAKSPNRLGLVLEANDPASMLKRASARAKTLPKVGGSLPLGVVKSLRQTMH